MVHDSEYVMAKADAMPESDRLRQLELCRDPGTMRRLDRLGVADGWCCLEVGAGRGSIARWLSHRVAPTGSVVAADIDPRFLTDMPENVEVRSLDVREDDVEVGHYDLVHCRALLMHLPDPAAALARLVDALRPGGLLLAEEGDFGLYHYAGHPGAEALNEIASRTLEAMTEAGIFNAYFGRRLPAMLPECGLQLRGTEIATRVSGPGEPDYEFARLSILTAVPRLVAAGVLEDADLTQLESYFGHPGTLITGSSGVAAWGQKPT